MKNKEKIISTDNFYIGCMALFQAWSLLVPLLFVLLICLLCFFSGYDMATIYDASPINRAGTAIQISGITYFFFAEYIYPMPLEIADELEGDTLLNKLKLKTESKDSYDKLIKFINLSRRIHIPIVRTAEFTIIILGTIINGFGDIIYLSLT